MNEVARAMTKISKNSNFDLDLRPTMLKCEAVQDIIILNNYVKLFENWSINKSARAMTNKFRGCFNRPGQYCQSGQYWSIEILSGGLNCFNGQLEIMVVSCVLSGNLNYLMVD